MKAMKPVGLPGKITETSLILPKNLSYKEIEHVLELLGGIGRSVGWWVADAILYAETKLNEDQFSQIVESLGWSPHSMQNALSVARAFPPSRRREGLAIGHHEAVARLDKADQDHWLDMAEKGEKLANGEMKRWSVSRLRQEMRSLPEGTKKPVEVAAHTRGLPGSDAPLVAEGVLIQVAWAAEGAVRYRVEGVSEHDEVLEVRARRAQG